MTSQRQLKVVLVLLLCVPLLYLKVVMLGKRPDVSGQGEAEAKAYMAANGIELDRTEPTSSGVRVFGHVGACRIQIKEMAPQGWDVSSMQLFSEGQDLVYVYDGAVYDRQPVWTTWIHYRVWRALRLIGVELERRVVFGVATSEECSSAKLDVSTLT